MLTTKICVASRCLSDFDVFDFFGSVPFSRKFVLGTDLVWIGWRFQFSAGHALLPSDKVKALQDLLRQVAVQGAKVLRKDVEKVITVLIWLAANVAVLAFVKGLLEGQWLRWGIY